MTPSILRAAGCAALCSTLTGCGTVGGKIAGGIALAAAAHVASAAIASATRTRGSSSASGRDRGEQAMTPAEHAQALVDEPEPAPAPGTCEAKRREFRAVYGSTRRLPPQLRCDVDGEFGAAQVYGASTPGLDGSED